MALKKTRRPCGVPWAPSRYGHLRPARSIGSGVFKNPLVPKTMPGFDFCCWRFWCGIDWLVGAGLAPSPSRSPVLFLPGAPGGTMCVFFLLLLSARGLTVGSPAFLWAGWKFWIIRSASISALAMLFIESWHDSLRQVRGVRIERCVLSFLLATSSASF